jgi:hypothetical protein
MESNLRTIKIDEKDMAKIEALQFEVNSYKSVIDFMITGGSNIANENFRQYHNEYVEKNTEYELAKRELGLKYFKDWVDICDWNLDFDTSVITVKKVKNI